MTSIFGHIKDFLSGHVEPIQHPFTTSKPGPGKPSSTMKIEEPDNLVTIAGRDFVNVDTNDGFEADIWVPLVNIRSDKIRPIDMTIVKNRRLNPVKYRELKRYWAAGKSAIQTAKELKNRRGFGVRTLEKYWSAFSGSLLPFALSGEGVEGEPQKTAKVK